LVFSNWQVQQAQLVNLSLIRSLRHGASCGSGWIVKALEWTLPTGFILAQLADLTVIRRLIRLTPAKEALLADLFVAKELLQDCFFLRPGEVSRKVAFVVEGVPTTLSRDACRRRLRPHAGTYAAFDPTIWTHSPNSGARAVEAIAVIWDS
jgi:hypothetical protein